MNKQRSLFEEDTSWVERIWQKIEAEKRLEILDILAQVASSPCRRGESHKRREERMNPDQITEAHRSRLALVYIRQSTTRQVEENRESQRRQRALVTRAEALGWGPERILEIDEDLGRSASRSSRRLGYEGMVSETALGKVGLIVALEVSRVSRGNRDWYHLLDVCAITGTLIADLEGIYEPGAYNDRLLLGLWER